MEVKIGSFDGHPFIKIYEVDFEEFSVKLTNYGATIVAVQTSGKNGKKEDVILGFDQLDDYQNDDNFMGCICGRYANRISGGIFNLDGSTYHLEQNNFPNHLHGGSTGFHRKVWEEEKLDSSPDAVKISFSHLSKHLEAGYPGNLLVKVCYQVTNNGIRIEYTAETDRSTHINLTNHSYFNLSGDLGRSISNSHKLQLFAHHYLPLDENQIPKGKLKETIDTPFDFETKRAINLNELNEELLSTRGYDHCYVLKKQDGELSLAAVLEETLSGRQLQVWTTEPGIQVYTGNFLDGTSKGRGFDYHQHAGICLETQHFPDSPNIGHFPSTLLIPGQVFKSATEFRFQHK